LVLATQFHRDYVQVTALRQRDGAQLWQSDPLPAGGYLRSGLLVADGLVLVLARTPEGVNEVEAWDTVTRRMRWITSLSPDQMPEPQRLAVSPATGAAPHAALGPATGSATGADLLFVYGYGGSVEALQLGDGRPVWLVPTPREALSAPGQPIPSLSFDGTIAGPSLLYQFAHTVNGATLLARREDDGVVVWSRPSSLSLGVGWFPSPSDPDFLGCVSPPPPNVFDAWTLVAFDGATGALRWQRPRACPDTSQSLPIEEDGVLYYLTDYIPTEERDLTLVALRASDGATLWRASAGGTELGFWALAVDHGVVFAVTIGAWRLAPCAQWWNRFTALCRQRPYLAAYDAATGARYWQVISSDFNGPWQVSVVGGYRGAHDRPTWRRHSSALGRRMEIVLVAWAPSAFLRFHSPSLKWRSASCSAPCGLGSLHPTAGREIG
jgi:outer membrane protein assembly factor BamB